MCYYLATTIVPLTTCYLSCRQPSFRPVSGGPPELCVCYSSRQRRVPWSPEGPAGPTHGVCVIAHANGGCVVDHADSGTRATPGPAHSRPDPRHTRCVCVFKAPRTYTPVLVPSCLPYIYLPAPVQAAASSHCAPIFIDAASGAQRGRTPPPRRHTRTVGCRLGGCRVSAAERAGGGAARP